MYALSKHKHNPYLNFNRKQEKMAKFTKLSFCQNLYFGIKLLQYCIKAKYQIVSAKTVVQVDFPTYALSMHKQNTLRITKGNNSWPLALFILIQIFILWISMCLHSLMKFHHIKEKPKCCGQRITKGNYSNRIGP